MLKVYADCFQSRVPFLRAHLSTGSILIWAFLLYGPAQECTVFGTRILMLVWGFISQDVKADQITFLSVSFFTVHWLPMGSEGITEMLITLCSVCGCFALVAAAPPWMTGCCFSILLLFMQVNLCFKETFIWWPFFIHLILTIFGFIIWGAPWVLSIMALLLTLNLHEQTSLAFSWTRLSVSRTLKLRLMAETIYLTLKKSGYT